VLLHQVLQELLLLEELLLLFERRLKLKQKKL
jgi:hypothetical protein